MEIVTIKRYLYKIEFNFNKAGITIKVFKQTSISISEIIYI